MPSIAEALASAVEKAESGTLTELPEANLEQQSAAPEPTGSPSEPAQPEGRTAGRARDDKGRLLPGAPERPERTERPAATPNAAQPGKSASSPAPAAAASPAEPKPAVAKPSTWKKELDAHWQTLPAEVQQEILRREGDYAKGVSTYKTEFDRLKGWDEAIQPFIPTLQQHGLDPVKHTVALMQAHQTLALGSPEQKLSAFAQLAQQYGVPLQSMFVRGQDGQVYLNQQLLNQPASQPQPARQQSQQDPRMAVREILNEERAKSMLSEFEAQASEKYPHYENKEVKATMGRLLDSGLANDLPSAYATTLALPQFSHLRQADEQQNAQAEAQRVAREKADLAARARSNALSVRSASPTGAQQGVQAKGLRGAIESAFDDHATGRV